MHGAMTEGKKHEISEEKQLKQELQRLRILGDAIDEEVYVTDPETHEILFVNKKMEKEFGKNIVGKKCYRVFQSLSEPCSFCNIKQISGKNLCKSYVRELQNQRNKRWYRSMGKIIKWPGGKLVRYGLAIDINEQKKMEEGLQDSEERFRLIVENSHDGITIIDDNFKIIYVNNELSHMIGYPKEEMVGQDFRKFLDKESKAMVQDKYVRKLRGENVPPRYEFRVIRKNGEKKDVEIKSSEIRDRQGRIRIIGQLLDITERKRMERESIRFEGRLSALNKYGQNLNMATSMKEIYKLTLDAAEKTLGFEIASILIIEGKKLCLVAQRGYPKGISIQLQLDGDRGITTEAARKCKSVCVQDVRKDKAYFGGFLAETKGNQVIKRRIGRNGILSELAVPIMVGNKVLGALNVESKRLAAFNGEDRKLLEILASHAATAITNLKRQERLSALNEYGQNLNMATSMEEICKLTLDAMEKTLGFEFATVFMVEGKNLQLVAHRGYPKKFTVTFSLGGDRGVSTKAARRGKAVFIRDVRKEKAFVPGRPGMLSELAVPIKAGNETLGVLNVESERLAAFDENDRELFEILASHAATAISNLWKQDQLRGFSRKLAYLMKNTTEIMNVKEMHQRLRVIAKAMQEFGWRRVVISLRDENLEGTDLVSAGLTREETRLLLERKAPGDVWKKRLGPKFERFKIAEFYYLPWTDSWIREKVHGVSPEACADEATTYAGVPSRLSPEEMVNWHPQDMLYAPLRTPSGRIVGILSMDDPVDGRVPTKESLAPLELFLHQAAIIIENAQLIESLKQAREQLEQKVDESTRELRKSQEQLLKAQRLAVIGELAGMVGHDLRNPLTSIAAATYYVKMRQSPETNGKITEMLELIEKNIAYSNKIINDLLDYSREIDLELSEHTPKSIVKESLSSLEVPSNVQVIDLTESRPKVKVDIDKIKRACLNLIRNALDAMPEGGTLTMKSEQTDSLLRISFSDTGMGISKETMERLWTPLFTTKAKGMGFGLPICKRIVEAHGGSIVVESRPGKGTTFTITIPIQPKAKEGGEEIWVKSLESSLLTTTKT
jgi:PAS domain S-box-containing protein